MKIYHQAGHNTKWNVDSLNDGMADGIIFSPVHYTSTNLVSVDQGIKNSSLFDPQFYVPDSQKNKINTYSFFPETMMSGFSTVDYHSIAHETAEACLDFQEQNNFEALVIPSRYFPDLLTDFIDRQKAFTVEPFLSAISNRGTDKPIFLTLPLTSPMVLDVGFREELLNWITSYPEIDGVYLLVNFDEQTKQIQSFDKLNSYISFANELKEADLKVICGYLNTEGILLAAADVHAVTIGAYENTRGFSIDKFLDNDQVKRGPAPRIFLPKLLNWIRYDTAIEIREDFPALWEDIYTATEESEGVFDSGRRPHFTQPALYKAHFSLMSELYASINTRVPSDRIEFVRNLVLEAHQRYERITSEGIIFFDSNCKGDHLPVWNRILRQLQRSS
jgi:hypothetical protein